MLLQRPAAAHNSLQGRHLRDALAGFDSCNVCDVLCHFSRPAGIHQRASPSSAAIRRCFVRKRLQKARFCGRARALAGSGKLLKSMTSAKKDVRRDRIGPPSFPRHLAPLRTRGCSRSVWIHCRDRPPVVGRPGCNRVLACGRTAPHPCGAPSERLAVTWPGPLGSLRSVWGSHCGLISSLIVEASCLMRPKTKASVPWKIRSVRRGMRAFWPRC